jgi:hypothetical protein
MIISLLIDALGHVDEQDDEYVFHFLAHVWQHAGCLAARSASSH